MEWTQWVLWGVDAVLVIVLGLVGIVANSYKERLDDLEEWKDTLPSLYARRDDTLNQFNLVLTYLRRIEDKLDNKMDRPRG